MITPNGEQELKIETTREGIIRIDSQFILTWLQFEGGHIRGVRREFDNGDIEFLIEHKDMPDRSSNCLPETICPIYQVDYSEGLVKTVTRTAPIRVND